MFCVECGAEGPVYEGLCAKCFPKKHPVVVPVEVLDIDRCTSCGSFRLRSGWSKVDRDLALPQLLREAMPALPPYERVVFTHVAREEDPNNLALTVKAVGRFQDLAPVKAFHLRVRIKPTLCDPCQKQRGRYYEGILQVRGEDRELAPRELRAVRTFVVARVDRSGDSDAFVSRIEEVHGGLDFYVSTNALGKGLARDLAGAFGGTVSSSPKLYGQKQGREVYRVTSLVRLPAFQKGDVVRHKGSLAEVTSVRPFVVLRDLATGVARRFKPREVRGARHVDAERFEARFARLESGEVVAIHPDRGEERPIQPRPKADATRGVVIWTEGGAYLSMLPADAVKD
ncbi:MAG: 60S ribosomal export protein NMD3 [Thermoplasmata archaeon]